MSNIIILHFHKSKKRKQGGEKRHDFINAACKNCMNMSSQKPSM